jgi:hypothetical protein
MVYKELKNNKKETQSFISYFFNSFLELGWEGAAVVFFIISIAGIFQMVKMW